MLPSYASWGDLEAFWKEVTQTKLFWWKWEKLRVFFEGIDALSHQCIGGERWPRNLLKGSDCDKLFLVKSGKNLASICMEGQGHIFTFDLFFLCQCAIPKDPAFREQYFSYLQIHVDAMLKQLHVNRDSECICLLWCNAHVIVNPKPPRLTQVILMGKTFVCQNHNPVRSFHSQHPLLKYVYLYHL